MTETIARWQKRKTAPAVRSLIDPFSLHAYAAPLHHPPAPASFRSSLRGICSMPIRVGPVVDDSTSTAATEQCSNATTQQQHT